MQDRSAVSSMASGGVRSVLRGDRRHLGLQPRPVARHRAAAAAAGRPASYPWAFYRPWGVWAVLPAVLPAFWFFVLRILIRGGGPWRRGWRGYYGDSSHDVPPMFEEWHRRAHERNRQPPPPQRP